MVLVNNRDNRRKESRCAFEFRPQADILTFGLGLSSSHFRLWPIPSVIGSTNISCICEGVGCCGCYIVWEVYDNLVD
ncbi:hypothetical protein ACMFMG_011840 [Clarireedia jacksonii]